MTKVPEEIKKKLLEYPFSTSITTPLAGKIVPETAKTSETFKFRGVKV